MKTIEELIEAAKTSKKKTRALKNTAVALQDYELAAKMREIELAVYPVTQDEKTAKQVKDLLGMMGYKAGEIDAYKILKAITLYLKKKDKVTLQHISEIVAKAEELFD